MKRCIEKWEYLVVRNFIRGHVGRLPFMPIVLGVQWTTGHFRGMEKISSIGKMHSR
jgi:hypothetical protein